MHNQHAGLSQTLAEQHITEHHEQAAHARLSRGARPPRRRRRAWVARRWWQLARWPGVAADQPVSRPQASLRRTRGRVRVRQVACMCLWWHLMGPVRPLHVG
jgi:hypothetical protein